jgi:hypothetical protein
LRAVIARRALDAGMNIAPEEHHRHARLHRGSSTSRLRAGAQTGRHRSPSNPRATTASCRCSRASGLRALEIPASPKTGLSVDALAFALQTHAIKAVVAVPDYQNPLSSVMPDADKARLVTLCEQHGVPLIEDDTYRALGRDDVPLRALKSWDESRQRDPLRRRCARRSRRGCAWAGSAAGAGRRASACCAMRRAARTRPCRN